MDTLHHAGRINNKDYNFYHSGYHFSPLGPIISRSSIIWKRWHPAFIIVTKLKMWERIKNVWCRCWLCLLAQDFSIAASIGGIKMLQAMIMLPSTALVRNNLKMLQTRIKAQKSIDKLSRLLLAVRVKAIGFIIHNPYVFGLLSFFSLYNS